MNKNTSKSIGKLWLTGCCIGIAMDLPLLQGKGELLGEVAMKTWEHLNLPALSLATWWTQTAVLPPHGEIASVIVPICTILVQWNLIGFGLEVCWALFAKSNRSKVEQP